ncbi:ABC transporter permease [Bordetella genomosp. 8]|uniref:ABC transporter permease n=1 Tax=Bordetella genomosp. 8 TaxID=1416806 RepID=UPI000A3219F6|nr:ABC transporter permease [Bordetella genomosp. 8]
MRIPESRLALPLAALFVVCFLAPLFVLLALSLQAGTEAQGFSLGRISLAHYQDFFADGFNDRILAQTLLLGAKVTAVCLLFGFPVAWMAARARGGWQSALTLLIVLPILTSVVVRTFAWIVILGRHGIVNQLLQWLGMADDPVNLLFTETGVIIVLAQVQMPLMVLPIMTVLSKLDPNLLDASQALGAGPWRTLRRVVVPLAAPGILAGCILTYAASVTAFVTQTLIGGARLVYMPLRIYQEAMGANNWPYAAAISIVFMVAVLAVIAIAGKIGNLTRSRVHA